MANFGFVEMGDELLWCDIELEWEDDKWYVQAIIIEDERIEAKYFTEWGIRSLYIRDLHSIGNENGRWSLELSKLRGQYVVIYQVKAI